MAEVTGAYLAAKALQKEGVDTFFYLLSAPIVADCLALGMKGILVRNETSAGIMAHGYARATGKPGLVLSSHGPGTANVVSALANATADACPVINFGASSNHHERHSETFQEMDQVALMKPATKWATQVNYVDKVPELVSIAFREALTPPHGAVYIDMPSDVIGTKVDERQVAWPSNYRTESRAYGDPALVKKAIDLLSRAQKPVMFTGSGVMWSQGSKEMQDFVNATGIPFYTTPQGRGVVPEDHARFFPGGRSMAFHEADVVLVVGTRSNVISGFFTAPRWNKDAKFIVVNMDPSEIGHNGPVEIGIIGDAKAVLGQLTEAAKGRFNPSAKTPWIDALAARDARHSEQQSVLMDSNTVPMHPLRLMREVRDFMQRDAYLIVDGHETLNFARQSIPTYMPFHRMNSGTHGNMGVGVPFAIGTQAAHPNAQVIAVTGDGAFGWHGMEIDTAIRHKLNVLWVVSNNANFTAGDKPANPQKRLGFQRYDKMMEALGGHGELVERPEQIRPALDRAAASGKPALVNVFVDEFAKSSTNMGIRRADLDEH
ncbi:MAG: thiamine pyrophosphate-binding protein [Dehalococcoidia bacterium]|nr:thiamine pyrophosphate-binding protein [Dehalococcoidia bacterium]